MFANQIGSMRQFSTLRQWMALLGLLLAYNFAYAQTPSPCQPDANGDFIATQSITCQVPEPDGVFNFRNVDIRPFVNVTFAPNAKNTPFTIRATGDVIISGRFIVDGGNARQRDPGKPGPGGFQGGRGGSTFDNPNGMAGDGPGGGGGGLVIAGNAGSCGAAGFATPGDSGGANGGAGGPSYGSTSLLPLIGGSGGGGSAGRNGYGGGGSGGGGAILIASSGSITFPERNGDNGLGIYARSGGADFGSSGPPGCAGSGGAIRLVAAKFISGTPNLRAHGATAAGGGRPFSGLGYIRVEAPDLKNFEPRSYDNTLSRLERQPNPITLPNAPQLTIKKVGGKTAPAEPTGSFYTPQADITLEDNTANPVDVEIEAKNLRNGTEVKVIRVAETGARAEAPCMLAGNETLSTCTAKIDLPKPAISVITATVTINVMLAFGKPLFLEGERVNKVEIAAAFGSPSEVTYITESGRRLKWPQ